MTVQKDIQFITRVFFPVCLATFFIMLLIVNNMDMRTQADEQNLYCEMVELFEQSKGEFGWPDYQKNVDCGVVAK